ncbi:hypothetical protein I656_02885 [Geobacillus sp. WSUCF1]|nr:hypothetical protein I656_02885 [Geobacillus sp. WSUCF1]
MLFSIYGMMDQARVMLLPTTIKHKLTTKQKHPTLANPQQIKNVP